MSKKVNWAEADKRIRGRRRDVSTSENNAIDAELQKLPDLVEAVEIIDIAQPAVAPPEEDEPAEEVATEEPN